MCASDHTPTTAAGVQRGEGEDGFAMIVAMVTGALAMLLVTMMLATGVQLQTATDRSKRWNSALQVAEAGVERAVAHLGDDDSYPGTGTTTEAVPGGEFETTVTSPEPGWKVVESTGWVPSKGAPRALNRRLRVTYGPARSFPFALFSDTTLTVKNDGGVKGNVFANESILVQENSTVRGNVTSATGTVQLLNNAKILAGADGATGTVRSGGFHLSDRWGIRTRNGSVVAGDVRAQVESCDAMSIAGSSVYNVVIGGSVAGEAVAGGTVTGSAGGGVRQLVCEMRQPRKTLPEFRYDPSLYEGEVEWASVAAFMAGTSQRITGVHRVVALPGEVLELQRKTIAGDLTLITDARVLYDNAHVATRGFYDGPSDAEVRIIVLNGSRLAGAPAIEIRNQLNIPSPSPAVLFYALGLIDVKNNADTNGAVYAGILDVKNNLDITYDPRVERTIGFGPVRYERVRYLELKPIR